MACMDSPWDEDAAPDGHRNAEWSRISEEFTTSGYREGITAGKESALQEGFDSGFANVGVPIGREIGILRGMISALLAALSGGNLDQGDGSVLAEARSISSQLSNIRFSDIAPRDFEAEAHALEHLGEEDDDEMEENEELGEKRKMEKLEDMLGRMSAGASAAAPAKQLTMEDVQKLKTRILSLCTAIGFNSISLN
ncbi:hypothetical protein D9757_003283 [Collybiopsis confluens]|uniref:Protein YAE1 n=1 Tax=Collybiopsis confluens TaxID=2823264 RepID=A0A8H5HYT6_9AGAR|nr:hypothetical protein D9757_003283 [Collybiopsis confluens]